MTRWYKRSLWIVPLVTVSVRWVVALVYPEAPLNGDALQYDAIAWNLASGQGFSFLGEPTALRPPLYPAFLAGLYSIVGHELVMVRFAQGVLDAVLVLSVLLFGKRVFGELAAMIGAVLVAFHPGMIWMTTQLLSETLFTLLFVTGVFLFLRCQSELDVGTALGSGVLFGLASLCRPTALLLPLAFTPGILWMDRRARRGVLLAAVLAMTVLVVSPWTIRNAVRFDRFTAVSTSSLGHALWYGSYPPWDLEWRGWDEPPLDEILGGLDEARDAAEIEQILIREAWGNIREHPGNFLVLMARKTWNLWRPTPGSRDQVFGSSVLFYGFRGFHVAFIAVSFFGLLKATGDGRRELWLSLVLIYWTAVHAATIAVPRYLIPLVPLLSLYVGLAFSTMLRAGKGEVRAFDHEDPDLGSVLHEA